MDVRVLELGLGLRIGCQETAVGSWTLHPVLSQMLGGNPPPGSASCVAAGRSPNPWDPQVLICEMVIPVFLTKLLQDSSESTILTWFPTF